MDFSVPFSVFHPGISLNQPKSSCDGCQVLRITFVLKWPAMNKIISVCVFGRGRSMMGGEQMCGAVGSFCLPYWW